MVIFFHVIDIERRLCERHIKFFITSKQSEFLSVLFNIFKAFVAIFLAVFSWCGGCRTRRATAVIHIVRRPSPAHHITINLPPLQHISPTEVTKSHSLITHSIITYDNPTHRLFPKLSLVINLLV